MQTEEKDFVSYIDDDGKVKNQHVIIIEENSAGIRFKFKNNDWQSIFIPWHNINKIKRKEEVQDGD